MKILSFDIEEWFLYPKIGMGKSSHLKRIEYYLDDILNELDELALRATFFCVGQMSIEYPQIIKKISNRGHEIACHSHEHKWLNRMSYKEFDEDTYKALSSLEDVVGEKVRGFRAPAFTIGESNRWAFDVLMKNGIEYDCSVFPAKRDFGGFESFSKEYPCFIEYNGVKIKEFPMATTEIFGNKTVYSGGGYFRLFPYNLIKKRASASDYLMTYFHIRDFDKEQLKKYDLRYIKNYYGINNARLKLSKLLRDFEFISVAEADKELNWNNVDIIRV